MKNTTLAAIYLTASTALSLSPLHAQSLPKADVSALKISLTIDASKTLRSIHPKMLGGTNVAYWNTAATFTHPVPIGWMKEMNPGLIRIPGGSWSDGMMWNGNGVRDAHGKVDATRIGPDGWPAIDYSGYAPSFAINYKTLLPVTTGFNGNVDVKTMQDYVRSIGAKALVCVNGGSGRPVDAAEWVRWTNIKRKA